MSMTDDFYNEDPNDNGTPIEDIWFFLEQDQDFIDQKIKEQKQDILLKFDEVIESIKL
jgi:hypothetical protein